MSIDSENLLFKKLNSYHDQDFPQLIARSQFNRRKKDLLHYIDKVRATQAQHFVATEQYFIVDSTAPDKGYCASRQMCIFMVTSSTTFALLMECSILQI